MKKLFTIFLILISPFVFSQTKESVETKITSENFKKAVYVRDIVPELQSNYDVIQAEYTFLKKGIKHQEVAGNKLPPSLLNYTFSSGNIIYIELKVKVSDNTKSPKILAITKKITIE